MSTNLNPIGQGFLAITGSLAVNAIVHPLCTINSRLMAKESILPRSLGPLMRLRSLYQGYNEICATDSASFLVTYVVNGILKSQQMNPLASAVLAGMASSPVVTVGEALMVNRQVNGSSLNMSILKNALRVSGLFATVLREVPFSMAIFSFAPLINRRMTFSNELTNNTISGLISGIICGALTAPADKIKILVQARELSFFNAVRGMFRECSCITGVRGLLQNAAIRAVYIGLAVGILNIFNNQLPVHMPNSMKEKNHN